MNAGGMPHVQQRLQSLVGLFTPALLHPAPKQSLPHVRGFISFALGADFLSRFINFVMWLLMTVK